MRSALALLAIALLAQLTICLSSPANGMPSINLASASIVNATLVLAGQTTRWYKVSAIDGSYSIKFPGLPLEKTHTTQTKSGVVKYGLKTYETNRGARAYFSSSAHYPFSPHYNVEKGLDGARDGAAKSSKATITSETRIRLNGVPGRQVYMTLPQGKAKLRLYLVNASMGPSLYQAFVIDSSGNVDDAEANNFLNSLTINRH